MKNFKVNLVLIYHYRYNGYYRAILNEPSGGVLPEWKVLVTRT